MKIKALKEEQNNASAPSGGSGAYKVANSISMMRGDNKIDVSIVVNVKAGSEDEAKRIANEQIKKVMSYVRGVDDEDVFGTGGETGEPFADMETVPQDLDQVGADDYPDDFDGGDEIDPQMAARDFWDNEGEGTSNASEEDDDFPSFKEGKVTEGAKPSSGLSARQRSNVVKAAKAGKDLGTKGKREFKKVEKAAEKQYGSKEAGKKVAAAAMWKKEAKKRGVKEGFNIDTLSISQIEEMVVKTAHLVECVDEISKIVDSTLDFKSTEGSPKAVADIARKYVDEHGADWSEEEKNNIVNKVVQKYFHQDYEKK